LKKAIKRYRISKLSKKLYKGDFMYFKGYVGTYTGKGSEGIYTFDYDGESLENIKLFSKVKNPKYLCFVEDYIATLADFSQKSGLIIYDKNANIISSLAYEDTGSCYICYENERIYTANYHEGSLSVIEFKNGELRLIKNIKIRDKAGAHQVLLTEDKILVPCLFLDKIIVFDKKTLEIQTSIDFEEGAGPRHGIFSDDGAFLYVAGELSNRVYCVDMRDLKVKTEIDLLENGESFVKDSAAIRKQGELLYVSTRTKDVISVIKFEGTKMERLQLSTCYGEHPRDFIITNDNKLIIANRFTNSISLVELREGLVAGELSRKEVFEAVSIILKENNNE
jgi:hypothetical protein